MWERERKQERMSSKIRMRRVYVLDPTPAAGSCKPPCCSVVFVRAPPPCYVCWCARVCLPMRACVCVLRFECVAICVCCCCFFFYHLSGCACAALPLAACSARALLLLPAACCLLLPSSFRTVVGRQARAWTKRKWGGHTAYRAESIIIVDANVDSDVACVGSSVRPTNLLFAYSKISLKIVYSLVWHEMKVSFGPPSERSERAVPPYPFCMLQKLNGDAAPFSTGAPSIAVWVCVSEREREIEQTPERRRTRCRWGRIWAMHSAGTEACKWRMRRGNFSWAYNMDRLV